MVSVIVIGVLGLITGYGIYVDIGEMFIAGAVGFMALAINMGVGNSRLLDIISFVTVLGAIGYGGYLFYLNSFLGA